MVCIHINCTCVYTVCNELMCVIFFLWTRHKRTSAVAWMSSLSLNFSLELVGKRISKCNKYDSTKKRHSPYFLSHAYTQQHEAICIRALCLVVCTCKWWWELLHFIVDVVQVCNGFLYETLIMNVHLLKLTIQSHT